MEITGFSNVRALTLGVAPAALDEFRPTPGNACRLWPDAAAGLAALRGRLTVATLSSGNRAQQRALGLAPEQVM